MVTLRKMKVICNRGALLEGLNVASSVVMGRTPKPVLQCVKVSARDNQLTLWATDLELSLVYRDNQVEISEPGEILVQADKFRDIVRESIDDTLSIELSGEVAELKGQDSLFKIPTQPVDTFPSIGGEAVEPDFEIQGGLLKKLSAQTVFAAATASTRYAFNGVLAVANGKSILMVSTDGHRLAQSKGDLSKPAKNTEKEGIRAIIPTKAMTLIDRLIVNPEEPIGFHITSSQAVISTPQATLTTSLVDGQFPPFEDVIPRDTDRQMKAATADFLSAVRRASLVTTEESKGVRLKFGKSGLVISSQSPSAGESKVDFPCKYEGPDFEIGFNPLYLTDGLKAVNDDEVSLEMTAANRPGLIKGGSDFLYVIMPVNLQ